jgi:hypothetical protein
MALIVRGSEQSKPTPLAKTIVFIGCGFLCSGFTGDFAWFALRFCLGVAGAALVLFVADRIKPARYPATDTVALVLGFHHLSGDPLAGLTDWPPREFSELGADSWRVDNAYSDADSAIRIFSASFTNNGETYFPLFAATIRVEGAAYPRFTLGRERHDWRTSMRSVRGTPTLANAICSSAYVLDTEDPDALDARLSEHFVAAWHTVSTWHLEGMGDWVLLSKRESVSAEEWGNLAREVLLLADALRADVRATSSFPSAAAPPQPR